MTSLPPFLPKGVRGSFAETSKRSEDVGVWQTAAKSNALF
jgi:hypothetical protein